MPRYCCLNNKGNEILFRIHITLPLTTITGLDGAGLWLGLPGHQNSQQWTSTYGAILGLDFMSPFYAKEDLIAHTVKAATTIRQQPDIFESHVNLCSVIVGCISRSEVVHLNICSKLVQNTTFLQNTSVVLLDFQP